MWEKVCLMRKNADKFNKKHYQGGMKKYKEWNKWVHTNYMKHNQQALWSCSPCNIARTLIPREKVKDTQGLLFFLSCQDLWIVMAASFSSQDKRIPPPLLLLEVLPFSQSVTKKSQWNDNIIFHSVLNSHVNQLQQIKETDEKERSSNPMGLSWTSILPWPIPLFW